MPIYDLTSLLTTISSASASFIAILGGLVASKLLTISSERDAVLAKISELDKEISAKESQKDTLQKENNDSDALDFIELNITGLLHQISLERVYENSTDKTLSIDTLLPYWEKGTSINTQIQHSLIPGISGSEVYKSLKTEAKREYLQDSFEKSVSLIIINYLEDDYNRNHLSPFSDTVSVSQNMFRSSFIDRQHYEYNSRTISELTVTLDSLYFQKAQYEKDKESLKAPAGVSDGLNIFGRFSLACIVLPLILLPFETTNIYLFLLIKIFFIGCFSWGLLSTFLYMKKILSWSESEKDNENNKEV